MEIRSLDDADRPGWPTCAAGTSAGDRALLGRLHHPALLPGWWPGRRRAVGRSALTRTRAARGGLLATDRPGRSGSACSVPSRSSAAGGVARLWLAVTNDNTPALRFYQRRGWDVVALHAGRWNAIES